MRKGMKGGKNWCCNGNTCNEQGWAPTCTPGNVKYVCEDYLTDPDSVTTKCTKAEVSWVNAAETAARNPIQMMRIRGGKRKTNKRRR